MMRQRTLYTNKANFCMTLIRLLGAAVLISVCYASNSLAFDMTLFKKKPALEVSVLDAYAELHTGPSRGFPVFFVVEKGQKITILKRRTGWYKVKTNKNKTGWVNRDQLENTLGPEGGRINFSEPDRQNYMDRRWELGVLGGSFSSAKSFTNYLGYHFTPNMSAEVSLTKAFGAVSSSQLININLIHQPFPEWTFSPFVTLGTGELEVSPRSSLVQIEDTKDTTLTVGGGFMFYATRRLLLRVEYNSHTVLTTREDNEEVDEWKAGFSVFF